MPARRKTLGYCKRFKVYKDKLQAEPHFTEQAIAEIISRAKRSIGYAARLALDRETFQELYKADNTNPNAYLVQRLSFNIFSEFPRSTSDEDFQTHNFEMLVDRYALVFVSISIKLRCKNVSFLFNWLCFSSRSWHVKRSPVMMRRNGWTWAPIGRGTYVTQRQSTSTLQLRAGTAKPADF